MHLSICNLPEILRCKIGILLSALHLCFAVSARAQLPVNTEWSAPASFQDNITSGIKPHLDHNGQQWITVFSAKQTSASDHDVMFSKSNDGHIWTVPVPLHVDWNTDNIDDIDAKIEGAENGVWICIWRKGTSAFVARTVDNGDNWSNPAFIGYTPTPPNILRTADGFWVIALGTNGVRSQDDGFTWSALSIRSSFTEGVCSNSRPCSHFELSNPVISGSHRALRVILAFDLKTTYNPGYLNGPIREYYGEAAINSSSNLTYVTHTESRSFEQLLLYTSKVIEVIDDYKLFTAEDHKFRLGNYYGPFNSLSYVFSHPDSTIPGSSKVSYSDAGHRMGMSIISEPESTGSTTSLVATLGPRTTKWEPTHIIDTSGVTSNSVIQYAELKSSHQGQFITVYQVENDKGESHLWYSTMDRFVIDSDGDGVADVSDLCPDTPNGDVVDENGCTIPDLDGDGVLNENDQCPDTPEGDVVDENGCTITDLDGDGVLNENDQCANTPEGDVVDVNGCSIPQNCPCGGPRAGGLYRNKGDYVRCLKQQAKQYVKDSLLTKKTRKELLKRWKQFCMPTTEIDL